MKQSNIRLLIHTSTVQFSGSFQFITESAVIITMLFIPDSHVRLILLRREDNEHGEGEDGGEPGEGELQFQ